MKLPNLFKKPKVQDNTRPQLTLEDTLAPSEIEVDFDNLRIDGRLFRTYFVSNYPRFVESNWLEPLVSFDHSLLISMFIYPSESGGVLDELKRKIAEMQATIQTDLERGRAIDPAVEVALEDAQGLQDQLVRGVERFFQFSLYVTVPSASKEELHNTCKLVESTLASLSMTARAVSLQMEDGFKSSLPLGADLLNLTHNMDTTSLATTFPFASSELTANEGIMYGINEHNDSLILFDRFTLENFNSVVFAKSGAGKSYLVKLEALRSLMFGTDVLVIDPEQEYLPLAEAVGGEFINFSPSSPAKINPFDMSAEVVPGENELGRKILSLTAFLKLILGNLTATEGAILDRALKLTYQQKGITDDPKTQINPVSGPPLMEDLYKVLVGMEEPAAMELAARLERFIKGSLIGIFSSQSTINISNSFTVFSVRDLPDQLRPLAIHMILDFVWTKIRTKLKKRIMIVDEAWYLMRNPDSAEFLVDLAKRARKYYLGLTTITQDVEDFLATERGKEIISNSSIQVLLKQAPVSIDLLAQEFDLSEGEQRLLLSAGVGQGLFFAGNTHVAMRVVAAPFEHQLITSSPEEILARQSV
ncbi:MAG: Type IV secretory pathway VirB4 components-like protein [Microgenomates group bacterium Gr01-1014_7]|nr:MAG: Type IV secretory pathway VirB4 components-like protein [Microgenomates group bacterium Gr01-1014_7]